MLLLGGGAALQLRRLQFRLRAEELRLKVINSDAYIVLLLLWAAKVGLPSDYTR